jgi:thiol-disulfide isomerase/thioredoxin
MKKTKNSKTVKNKYGKRKVLTFGLMLMLGLCVTGCSSDHRDSEAEEGSSQTVDDTAGSEEQGLALRSFEALTLDGASFTQEDLAQKDVTVINFWSTLCGPCLEEMPDIAKFEAALPDNVSLVTVCLDGLYDTERVEEILEEAGYEGITLIWGDGDFLNLCREILYTPTTIMVDQDGNMVGEVIIGGQWNLEETYTEAVNQVLTAMGKAEIGNAE